MARTDLGGTRPPKNLYDPAFEHDACGVGLVADLQGRPSHTLVRQGLAVLERLAHRGASGAEVATGDGAGILTQLPHRFLAGVAADLGIELGEPGRYAAGNVFLPTDPDDAKKARDQFAALAEEEALCVLGWREVPVRDSTLGETARRAQPRIEQVFVSAADPGRPSSPIELDRLAFVVRKRFEHQVDGVYIPSLSARTIVYKGMLTGHQVDEYYPDLSDERFESGLALVHSRFSTNTFPSWPLAHPYLSLIHI